MKICFSAAEKRFFCRALRWAGLEQIVDFHRVYHIWPWSVTLCNHCRTDVWPWQRRGHKRLRIGPYGHTHCILRRERERAPSHGDFSRPS